MELSIVTSLYQSAPHLREFYERMTRAAARITNDYELLLVNDGSPDDSLHIAVSLCDQDAHVRVIDLSRNFGHHKAVMTGLAHSQGRIVFMLDCDLEEDPELIGEFWARLLESDSDVVFGVQDARKGGLFERISGRLFYSVFNLLSDFKVPPNHVFARIMTRRYVDSLVAHREREFIIAGLYQLAGYEQLPLTIHKHSRKGSSYSLRRKLAQVVRGVTAFSNKPLIYVAYLGTLIVALSSLYILYLVAVRLFLGQPPEGFTALAVSIWFVGGLIIFCLGVVSIYLSVIFNEVKQRPYTIVRQVYEHGRWNVTPKTAEAKLTRDQ